MNLSIDVILILLYIFLASIFGLVLMILFNKVDVERKMLLKKNMIDFISKNLIHHQVKKPSKNARKLLRHKTLFFEQYIEYLQTARTPQIEKKANEFFIHKRMDKKYIRQLRSSSYFHRIEAAVKLGYITTDASRLALHKAMHKEHKPIVKLYIGEALSRHQHGSSLPYLINSLTNETLWFRDRMNSIISGFDRLLFRHLPEIVNRDEFEIQELIIFFAERYPAKELKEYLIEKASFNAEHFRYNGYVPPKFSLATGNLLHNKNIEIVREAQRNLREIYTPEALAEIIDLSPIDKRLNACKTEKKRKKLISEIDFQFRNATLNTKPSLKSNFYNTLIPGGSNKMLRKVMRWFFIGVKIQRIVHKFAVSKYYYWRVMYIKQRNAHLATKALLKNYPQQLASDTFLFHSDLLIQNFAISALAKEPTLHNCKRLYPLLSLKGTRRNAIIAISEILRHHTEFIDEIVMNFYNETNFVQKQAFAEILSNRIEFFLIGLKYETGETKQKYLMLITSLISSGLTSNIIGFLNRNQDPFIEKEILDVFKHIFSDNFTIEGINETDIYRLIDKNADSDVEKELISMVNAELLSQTEVLKHLKENTSTAETPNLLSQIRKKLLHFELRTYLKDNVLEKIEMMRHKPPRPKKEEKIEKDKVLILKTLHIITYLIFPIFFITFHFDVVRITPFWEQFTIFAMMLIFPIIYLFQHAKLIPQIKNWELYVIIILISIIPLVNYLDDKKIIRTTTFLLQADWYVMEYNYYLVFYTTSVSLIYIILVVLSFLGLFEQIKYAKQKKLSFLFKEKILPSISIIAPAYTEEQTIVESVNALLNLRYPNYELVVVCDGSPDNTLGVLINYYELEKVDLVIEELVDTQPIRGIYKNENNYPNLSVIDKVNGGKADALNVGINVAQKEFFCGIDADSLLEPDALMKLTAMMLNSENESVAFGGNILPINSCKVDRGKLESIHMPKEELAAFQTIEYIRAFMSGRVGWAYINSLLIISGAFGLFSKQRVVQMGGYLTHKSRYQKDTVGEDMELVVRLNRLMLENKLPYSVHYCYDANCWTEVPELLKMNQIQTKKWKVAIANFLSTVPFKLRLMKEEKRQKTKETLLAGLHISERMRILIGQRDRWHRGLIDILNFHRVLFFKRRYKQVGFVAMPYFLIFEMIGPIVEFQGYIMVVFASVLGLLNVKVAILLLITSILSGIMVSLSALVIAEKESNLFSNKEVGKLLIYAFVENFGPRQIANFWRVKGYFSSMKIPKGWGTMLRKAKPIAVLSTTNAEFGKQLQAALEKIDYKVVFCTDGSSALQNIKKENIRLAILHEKLPLADAYNIRREMMGIPAKRDIACLMLTEGDATNAEASETLKLQVMNLAKGEETTQLILAIAKKLAT